MNLLRIALLQILPQGSLEENRQGDLRLYRSQKGRRGYCAVP